MARQPAGERYIDAALELLDAGETLTLHCLGEHMGLTHTAVYRHFPDLARLVGEVAGRVLSTVLTDPMPAGMTPRGRITTLAHTVRGMFVAHPMLAITLLTSGGPVGALFEVQERVIAELRTMGLEGATLTAAYQALEGLVLGGAVADLTGAPDHLAIRRDRMRAVSDRDFRPLGRSEARVRTNNEAAFAFALEALLDACEAEASD